MADKEEGEAKQQNSRIVEWRISIDSWRVGGSRISMEIGAEEEAPSCLLLDRWQRWCCRDGDELGETKLMSGREREGERETGQARVGKGGRKTKWTPTTRIIMESLRGGVGAGVGDGEGRRENKWPRVSGRWRDEVDADDEDKHGGIEGRSKSRGSEGHRMSGRVSECMGGNVLLPAEGPFS